MGKRAQRTVEREDPVDREALITFQPDGIRGKVARGKTVMEAALMMGVEIASICGGNQACGKCKVILKTVRGSTPPITVRERQHLSEDDIGMGLRLACAAKVLGDTTVIVPVGSRRGEQRLQTEGIETQVEVDPFVEKITLRLREPSISTHESDEDILIETLMRERGCGELEFGLEAARCLSLAAREGKRIVTVSLFDGREIIGVEAGSTSDRLFGLAVDIGTTKLACYLVDLNDGATMSVSSMMNPQIPFGEDVISRINYTINKPEGLRELHEIVVHGTNRMIQDACSRAGVSQEEVYEMTVAGNTVMHHLFLNIPPRSLAFSPYTPAFSDPKDIEPPELGIGINPNGNVHALPIIAGFVGSDCVAGILATGIHQSENTNFLIDVGTNTEIVVATDMELAACSCASGPAFEGAHIRHGMRAASGAIERVWIDKGSLGVKFLTIDDETPRGICGSGIVDLLAEMLKGGIIDSTGRISSTNDNPRIREGGGGMEFVVVEKEDTAIDQDIVLTQRDVRELQKAKGAMYTGASILMRHMGVNPDDVDNVYIAGAFGNYLDPENMMAMGMLPDFPIGRVTGVGNAAGTGARMTLLSRKERRRADEIRRNIKYIELASDPSFQNEYIKSLNLPHMETERFPRTMERLRNSRFRVRHPR